VLISMPTSSDNDLPRQIEFLYLRNRLNVAIPRPRCRRQPQDIPAQQLSVSGPPLPPAGTEIRRVDIIVGFFPVGVDQL
jgi:hypothetical protein